MSDILKQHALDHVWIEPLQDFQHRIKPNRISPNMGFYKEAKVMWESIPLPNYSDTTDKRSFHVYPIGQLAPELFAITQFKPRQWYRADALVTSLNVTIDVYADNGTIIPRNQYYFYLNYDKNFILAIARNTVYLGDVESTTPYGETFIDNYSLDKSSITVRFYKNAITSNDEWLDAAVDEVDVLEDYYLTVNNGGNFNTFINETNKIIANYKGMGKPIYFRDGFVTSKPLGYDDAYKGSLYGFHFDETIKDIRFFDIATIPGFQSIKDKNKDKYLLVSRVNDGVVEYKDDCDYYLVKRDVSGNYVGVMIDDFNHKAVRQVTHNAWSVTQDSVIYPAAKHTFLNNVVGLTLMVVVRNGGMGRPLGLQSNRIEELYHLSYDEIIEAMTQVNGGVPEWRAVNLENSAYINVMSSMEEDITDDMVEEAYGYNAAVKSVARSLYGVFDGLTYIDNGKNISWNSLTPNPTPLSAKKTLFWYDAKGLLLGYSYNSGASTLITPPSNLAATAAKVEVISGELVVNAGPSGIVADTEKVYDSSYGFWGRRDYVCGITGSILDNKWVDVTGGVFTTEVTPSNGDVPYVQWNYSLLNVAGYYPASKFASTVNVHEPVYTTASFTGVYTYDIFKIENSTLSLLNVPPGHISVFLNGTNLIENLDFYYGRGGRIVVVRKPDTTVDNTDIIVRFYGYANSKTNKPFAPRDVGFVKNGLLSSNQVFNPWHDRDIRIVVGGELKFPAEVEFADGLTTTGNRIYDGKPYAVEDYITIVEPFTNRDTVEYKLESMDIDQRVSDYLTSRLPELEIENEYIEPYRHQLYSPVMARFIHLVTNGTIDDTLINEDDVDYVIVEAYKPIVDLYSDVDPVLLGFDSNYCYVHPHPHPEPVTVTSKQYAFLERVNRIFFKDSLDFTNSVKIKVGT